MFYMLQLMYIHTYIHTHIHMYIVDKLPRTFVFEHVSLYAFLFVISFLSFMWKMTQKNETSILYMQYMPQVLILSATKANKSFVQFSS